MRLSNGITRVPFIMLVIDAVVLQEIAKASAQDAAWRCGCKVLAPGHSLVSLQSLKDSRDI